MIMANCIGVRIWYKNKFDTMYFFSIIMTATASNTNVTIKNNPESSVNLVLRGPRYIQHSIAVIKNRKCRNASNSLDIYEYSKLWIKDSIEWTRIAVTAGC